MYRKLVGVLLAILLMCILEIAWADVTINEENFPDANFRTVVSEFDLDQNGVLSDTEIVNVTFIECSERMIKNLQGIEFFTALDDLRCAGNQITVLDISKNAALISLECSNNFLAALDVENNTLLYHLSCNGNQLSSLDISKNFKLRYLYCSRNSLTMLDVSNNASLEVLYCFQNQLTFLDVSKNTEIYDLSCSDNQLTDLDVKFNKDLTDLGCSSNKLTSLDLSENTKLERLNCENNLLTELDISKCPILSEYAKNNKRGESTEYAFGDTGMGWIFGVDPTVRVIGDGFVSEPLSIEGKENHLKAEEIGDRNRVVEYGGSDTFKVNATCDYGEITYQWQIFRYDVLNDEYVVEDIPGATSSSYTAEDIRYSETFWCKVYDSYGNGTSATFDVQVENHLDVKSVGNNSVKVIPGESIELEVAANCDKGALFYKWNYCNSATGEVLNIAGENEKSYKTPALYADQNYTCDVYDIYGTCKSVYFTISMQMDSISIVGSYQNDSAGPEDGDTVYLDWSVSGGSGTYKDIQIEWEVVDGFLYKIEKTEHFTTNEGTGSFTLSSDATALGAIITVTDSQGESYTQEFWINSIQRDDGSDVPTLTIETDHDYVYRGLPASAKWNINPGKHHITRIQYHWEYNIDNFNWVSLDPVDAGNELSGIAICQEASGDRLWLSILVEDDQGYKNHDEGQIVYQKELQVITEGQVPLTLELEINPEKPKIGDTAEITWNVLGNSDEVEISLMWGYTEDGNDIINENEHDLPVTGKKTVLLTDAGYLWAWMSVHDLKLDLYRYASFYDLQVNGDNAEIIVLPRNLTIIEDEAFLNLQGNIFDIPSGVKEIGTDAFAPGAILFVEEGSYAEDWAKTHGYSYKVK